MKVAFGRIEQRSLHHRLTSNGPLIERTLMRCGLDGVTGLAQLAACLQPPALDGVAAGPCKMDKPRQKQKLGDNAKEPADEGEKGERAACEGSQRPVEEPQPEAAARCAFDGLFFRRQLVRIENHAQPL